VIASSGPSVEPSRTARHPRPADGDLLVAGASRRDDYERVVIEDPPSAVAVAPPGHAARSREFGTISVASDGSAASERAAVTAPGGRVRHRAVHLPGGARADPRPRPWPRRDRPEEEWARRVSNLRPLAC